MNRKASLLGIINSFGLLIIISYIVFQNFRQQQLAYIDTLLLTSEYKGMIEAREKFQIKAQQWQASADTLAREFEGLVENYEAKKQVMSAKESQANLELIKTKRDQLLRFQESIKAKSQQEDQKMTNEVRSQINAYLKTYGEQQGYKIILGATELGNILYAKDGIDITKEVIDGLNKQYVGN